VPFPVKVPRCLPERVNPQPVLEVVPYGQPSDPPAVNIDFWYKDQKHAPNPMGSAVGLTEGLEPPNNPGIVVIGKHEILQGHEVILSTPPAYPAMDWTDGPMHFSMATSLTWDEALKVYRSLVDPAYQCT
jgi:hypothetical protein